MKATDRNGCRILARRTIGSPKVKRLKDGACFAAMLLCLLGGFWLMPMGGLANSTDRLQHTSGYREDIEAKERVVTDELGREVSIPVSPARIVVLATADVEILFALGAGNALAGVPDGVKYPKAALDIEKVGGMYGNFNAERVVEKEPDLILFTMSNWAQYRSHLDRLESYGLAVIGFTYPDTLAEILAHIGAIGDVAGRAGEARLLCDDIVVRIRRVREMTEGLGDAQRPKVYVEWMNDYGRSAGATTSGKDSREDVLIRLAGGVNIFGDVEKRSFVAGREEIVSRNPDVIILTANTDRRNPDELKAAIRNRPGWAKTGAVVNDRIYIVEDQLTWANPRIVLGLETFARCLHPELF